VPLTENEYIATDFVVALLETVMDYQNSTVTVERAGKYFETHAWDEARTLDDLERLLARFPADKDGNDALAQVPLGIPPLASGAGVARFGRLLPRTQCHRPRFVEGLGSGLDR
jgi:hypothetical protein